MKNLSHVLMAFVLSLMFLFASTDQAKACVDYHNDSVYVIVHYDSTNFTDVSLTLTNLRLFGGNPNQFCSCGITTFTNTFSNILYVAFVDSGTTNALAGFDVWDASANATNSWNNVIATGNWSGFVSMVNANGLPAGAPVELIIRARLPVGYSFYLLDSAIGLTQMGTDEWFDATQVLGNTHQSVSGIDGPFTYIAEAPGASWFTNLDAALMTGRKEPVDLTGIQVYPVPAQDKVYVALRNPAASLKSLELYDASGRLLQRMDDLRGQTVTVGVADLPEGIYFLKLTTDKGVQTQRLVKE
jgi:hypothetical protein